MIITMETLNRFTEKGSTQLLDAPMSDGKITLATDAKILIEVDHVVDGVTPNENYNAIFDKVKNVMAAIFDKKNTVRKFKPLPFIEKPGECPACKTTGMIVSAKCDACDGNGEFDHDGHTYECQSCDGRGTHHGRGEAIRCETCNGMGYSRNEINVGRSLFDTRYLYLISELPNATFAPDLKDVNGAAVFTFTGGRGAIMPIQQVSKVFK